MINPTHFAGPVLMAIDIKSAQFIRRLKGKCIFYQYDCKFSLFYQHEVWILYSDEKYFHRAIHLGRKLQQAGSRKTIVMLINV